MELDKFHELAEAVHEREKGKRWTQDHELLAQTVEMLDLVRRAVFASGGVKPGGQPLRLPRPDDEEGASRGSRVPAVSHEELMVMAEKEGQA